MKKFVKSLVSTMLIGSMLFSFAGCSVKFDAVKAKDFKKALEDAMDIDDDDYSDYDWDDSRNIWYYHKDIRIDYYQFDDADDAYDYFEDLYDEWEDTLDDGDFDGKHKEKFKDDATSGYILLNGESDNDDFYEGDIYGGIYFVDDIIIIAVCRSDKQKDMDKIDALLDAIGYSHL